MIKAALNHPHSLFVVNVWLHSFQQIDNKYQIYAPLGPDSVPKKPQTRYVNHYQFYFKNQINMIHFLTIIKGGGV